MIDPSLFETTEPEMDEQKAHRVIVAGTRTFTNYKKAKQVLDEELGSLPEGTLEIVSGGARGADTLGERWAEENDIPFVRFPAQWEEYGRAAGAIRNKQMVEYGTRLIAFWDGESRGTYHTIRLARDKRIPYKVIKIK